MIQITNMLFNSKTFVALALFATSFAVPLGISKRDSEGIKLEFTVERPANGTSGGAAKRDGYTSPLSNQQVTYRTLVSAGSNNQVLQVVLDTGSSDLWFVGANAECYNGCTNLGSYDPSTSTTSVDLGETFLIEYGDHSTSLGYYYTDSVSVGGANVHTVQFAVANQTSVPSGILGIGLITGEAIQPYPNFPVALVNQGLISKNFYSIYLNGPSATTGEIIFGGTDSSKYSGSLIAVPIVNPKRLEVNLDTLSFSDGTTFNATSTPVLDTGTTISFLPPNVADYIASKFQDAEFTGQSYSVSCDSIPDGGITFEFDKGAAVNVPYSSLVQNSFFGCTLEIGHTLVAENGEQVNILGDNFLTSAYVVYDITDNEISLAQAVWT